MNNKKSSFRVGLVGAGYIADWHAEAIRRCPEATLVGVVDRAEARADALARKYGIQAFGSLQAMQQTTACDAVHVLVPPGVHEAVARETLQLAMHCFVEKPLAPAADACESLASLAKSQNVQLGVNHNFLFLPSAEALVQTVNDCVLGPIRSIEVEWALSLPQIAAGPHGGWPFETPSQPLFEVGAHALSFARRLAPELQMEQVQADDRCELTLGRWCYRRWRLQGIQGDTAVSIVVDMGNTTPSMKVRVRGLAGTASVDFERDLFVRESPPAAGVVLGPLRAGNNLVKQIKRGIRKNAIIQTRSFDKLAPFGLSIARSVAAFYRGLHANDLERAHSASFAIQIAQDLAQAAEYTDSTQCFSSTPTPHVAPKPGADALITGATGFIGRHLVAKLVQEGQRVRIMTRGTADALVAEFGQQIEVVRGDLANTADVQLAMKGIPKVVHLARGTGKFWDDYIHSDIEPTKTLGKVALETGVEQLIYTGTIDSYDSASPNTTISDATPVDRRIRTRNLYAQAKAEGEKALIEMSQHGLPLTIARPGIVIGAGGPPMHWGVGMWFGPTTCRLWGDGTHPLPFVLVSDVADALALTLGSPKSVGESFLITGPPLLSARDYVAEYSRALGAQIDCQPKGLWSYYAEDMLKYLAKTTARKPAVKPTRHDWNCRAHKSRYQATYAESALGWRPTKSTNNLIERGINEPVRIMLE